MPKILIVDKENGKVYECPLDAYLDGVDLALAEEHEAWFDWPGERKPVFRVETSDGSKSLFVDHEKLLSWVRDRGSVTIDCLTTMHRNPVMA